MANITELQFQGDSTVHKLNDARITTTAVTNTTHILTTNSDVTRIAPITTSNLASALGVNADNARQYIMDNVNEVALEGNFSWDKGSAIIEIYAHTNYPTYVMYCIGWNNNDLADSIFRIENRQLYGSMYPFHIYYSGTAVKGRIVITSNREKCNVSIRCSTNISRSTNTDITDMTEKTFS